ncbi:hypothetical protein LCGC14_1945170 [marine sediment metagenome]|uniref:Uncharacterized protein n=1 Tax=marine sediment metagenome TaxID=412755 RepID=A0A0F9FJ23_9ZZZZ
MTFAQARARAESDLRVARAAYRRADSLGEIVERTLDRLITKRKRIVTPDQLLPMLAQYERYARQVVAFERALTIAGQRLRRYLL